jgi:hypothetical protein
MMAQAMTLISAQVLGSQSVITFSSIPQTYRDLMLIIATTASQNSGSGIQFNGDTNYTSNYSRVAMTGNGSTTGSFTNSGSSNPAGNHDMGALRPNGNLIAQILDYSATDKHKTILSRTNGAGNDVFAIALRWASTSAVTQMVITDDSGNGLLSGTTLYLYGIAG